MPSYLQLLLDPQVEDTPGRQVLRDGKCQMAEAMPMVWLGPQFDCTRHACEIGG